MASIEDVADLPVMSRTATGGLGRPLVGDVATVDYGTTPGEVDRYNMQRVVSFTANIHEKPLGAVVADIREAIARAGAPPRGISVNNRGQVPAFEETLAGLRTGLLLSILVIFLLLSANFQSFRLAFVAVATVPAVPPAGAGNFQSRACVRIHAVSRIPLSRTNSCTGTFCAATTKAHRSRIRRLSEIFFIRLILVFSVSVQVLFKAVRIRTYNLESVSNRLQEYPAIHWILNFAGKSDPVKHCTRIDSRRFRRQ